MDGAGEERFPAAETGEGGKGEADLVPLSLQRVDLRKKEGWEERDRERESTLMAQSHWQQCM